ncbi:MAG: hypothetical protein V1875_01415 [Candidatus Altiarchaeota archaeon]
MKTAMHAIIVLFLCGCIGSTVYVCPDGSKAGDPGLCVTKTEEKKTISADIDSDCMSFRTAGGEPDVGLIRRCLISKNPTPEFCETTPGPDRAGCLIEVAAYSNSTAACAGLGGNMRLICQAAAENNPSLCGKIGVEGLRRECKETAEGLAPGIVEKAGCANQTGDELAWCLIYNAEDAEECLKIDDRAHPDEAVFCAARVSGNLSVCGRVGDPVKRSLCLRAVSGL